MTVPEIAGLVAGVVTALATGVTAVVLLLRGRRSASTPFYSLLKASLDDPDSRHWVSINTGLTRASFVFGEQRINTLYFSGKVVRLTRETVTLDEPYDGNNSIYLSHIHTVQRLRAREEICRGWTPRFDSDGQGPIIDEGDESDSGDVESASSTK